MQKLVITHMNNEVMEKKAWNPRSGDTHFKVTKQPG